MRCLIVDDHSLTANGVSGLLKIDFPGYEITLVTTAQDAIRYINKNTGGAVCLLLLDLVLPDCSGVEVLKHIQNTKRDSSFLCLVMSGVNEPATIALCEALGAKGYISKTADPNLLAIAIRAISEGGTYFHTPEAGNALRSTQVNFLEKTGQLTNRQREVLDLVLAGHSNKKIADVLNLGYGTVKNRIHDLLEEFSVNTRLELATAARASGYVPQLIQPSNMRQEKNASKA